MPGYYTLTPPVTSTTEEAKEGNIIDLSNGPSLGQVLGIVILVFFLIYLACIGYKLYKMWSGKFKPPERPVHERYQTGENLRSNATDNSDIDKDI